MKTFPVKIPYKTTPSMIRNTESVFELTSQATSKFQELDRWDTDLYASCSEDLIQLVIDKLNIELVDFGHSSSIVNLALNFREDIAIMHKGILEAICFCYPSSWIPAERVGQSLTQIHAPVADNEILREKSQRIAESMATQHSFRRYVWTISTTSELSNHPKLVKSEVTDSTTIDELFFRTETQTTMALGDNETSLFFVRVDTMPLSQLWCDIDKRQTIVASVNSMTDSVLRYKNLSKIKEIINKGIYHEN
mgnify:CR=1 FL=1